MSTVPDPASENRDAITTMYPERLGDEVPIRFDTDDPGYWYNLRRRPQAHCVSDGVPIFVVLTRRLAQPVQAALRTTISWHRPVHVVLRQQRRILWVWGHVEHPVQAERMREWNIYVGELGRCRGPR